MVWYSLTAVRIDRICRVTGFRCSRKSLERSAGIVQVVQDSSNSAQRIPRTSLNLLAVWATISKPHTVGGLALPLRTRLRLSATSGVVWCPMVAAPGHPSR